MGEDELSARRTIVLLAVAVEGGLVGLALLLGWLAGRSALAALEWDVAGFLRGVLATLPLLLLFAVLRRWPVGPIEGVNRFCDQVIRPLFAPCSVVDLLGISVLAGLGEELFFRGVLQPILAAWSGNVWVGLALGSLLFGLLHAVTPTYAALATLMGVYFGCLTLLDANVLAAVVAHALYDFFVLLYLIYGFGAADPPDEGSGE